jgi:hypothetical protein
VKTYYLWGGMGGGGVHFGHFDDMYVKYISIKHVAFNFGFHFSVFGLDILIFTKLMTSNIV